MKKVIGVCLIIMVFVSVLSGCNKGGSSKSSSNTNIDQLPNSLFPIDSTPDLNEPKTNTPANNTKPSSGKFETIPAFTEEWTRLYELYDPAFNEYDGFPLIELPMIALPLAFANMYELLNLEQKDGRFQGQLFLSGYDGFIEKRGSKYTFGYNVIREDEGFTPEDQLGDKLIEEGSFDADAGYIIIEDRTERDGEVVSKSTAQYKRLDNGTFLGLYQEGSSYTSWDGSQRTYLTYITKSEKHYDFVIAKAEKGAKFDVIELKDSMTIDECQKLLQSKGYTIEKSGSVKNGKVIVNLQ